MAWKLNIFSGTLDIVRSVSFIDGQWLRLDTSNDPLTNELKISPSSDSHSLNLQKDMKIKSGEKIILDGI